MYIRFFENFLLLPFSSYILCGDINIPMDVACSDKIRLNDILQSCNLVHSVRDTTHILWHTLNVVFSPSDSEFVCDVSLSNIISGHTVLYSCPVTVKLKHVSYL